MPTYPFTIITPSGTAFQGQVESVVATGFNGQVGILAGHAPMICETRPGLVKATTGDANEYFAAAAGTLDVRKGEVVLLADWAARGSSEADARAKLASRPEREH